MNYMIDVGIGLVMGLAISVPWALIEFSIRQECDMKRYVKFSGDNCKLGNFTRNKAYEVVGRAAFDGGVVVIDNRKFRTTVVTTDADDIKCSYLEEKESWVFCDEHGNELGGEKKQGYKGQFDLADYDVWTSAVRGTEINITQILRMIAEKVG